jgi:hypothetical protein
LAFNPPIISVVNSVESTNVKTYKTELHDWGVEVLIGKNCGVFILLYMVVKIKCFNHIIASDKGKLKKPLKYKYLEDLYFF